MSLGLAYYICLLVSLIFGFWSTGWNVKASGNNLIFFVLFLLIGLKLFGPPIHS